MVTTVRAMVKRGRLVPLRKLDLPEGKEVTLTIADGPSQKDVDAALAGRRWRVHWWTTSSCRRSRSR